ncbi:MAG TPA: triose-phosphate isomerase [Gemmataceae bacterium]|nr:triose-phosphate isomerase [Gemmataceae bacterium]
MRKPFVAGNWKMYTTRSRAQALAAAVAAGVGAEDRVTVAVCPPFPYLLTVAEVLRGSKVALGAQNLYPETEGAFTGEVSPLMLKDVGCTHVILGHSERRRLGETDAFINRKVRSALAAGLQVILCLGETIDERKAGKTEAVLDGQLTAGLADVAAADLARLVLAYEPVWAIGTGLTATPDQAQEAHAFLRRRVGELYNSATAEALLIQYGGSVKPDNAASLLQQPDVDGALVGGASLKADDFLAIVRAALS